MESMEVEAPPPLNPRVEGGDDEEGYLPSKVVHYIRKMIEENAIRPGDKLASERVLAATLKMSRASLRVGIAHLAALGIVKVRQGVGTFLTDIKSEIQMLPLDTRGALHPHGSLHPIESWQWSEAHRQLEIALACLAAERGRKQDFRVLAFELEGMLAARNSRSDYFDHEMRFHQTIASASGNPFLAALFEAIALRSCDHRFRTTATCRDLKQRTQRHRALYGAICTRNAAQANALLHLSFAISKCRPCSLDEPPSRG